MKVAILGSGPLSIEMALYLHHLGAQVKMFCRERLGGAVRKMSAFMPELSMEHPYSEITTEVGRKQISFSADLSKVPTVSEFWHDYLSQIIDHSVLPSLVQKGEVLRVHKRFLNTEEDVEGRSRLADLFRVIWKFDPGSTLQASMQENPELFNKLGQTVVASLEKGYEKFEDFDLVIDGRGVLSNPFPMGPSQTEALNEIQLRETGDLHYGFHSLENAEQILEKSKSLCIIGSGVTAAMWLLRASEWIKNPEHNISLVTTEGVIFQGMFGNPSHRDLSHKLNKFLEEQMIDFEKACEKYEQNIRTWRDLDSHIKAKTPQPQEPIPRFDVYNGCNVSAVDRLLDRDGLFVTCETVDFRGERRQIELKTLGCDSIIVCTGYGIDSSIAKGLRTNFNHHGKSSECDQGTHPEAGYYTLGAHKSDDRYDLKDGIAQLPQIEENILSYFSRSGGDQ
jgi:hypothetical protein